MPKLAVCSAVLVVLAAGLAGCARLSGSDEAAVAEADFFLERFPDAPVALPAEHSDRVANVIEAVLDESGAVIATEIAFWSYADQVQKVCVRFSSEPTTLPSSCGGDVIATVAGVEVLGDRSAIDPELLTAKWERVSPT